MKSSILLVIIYSFLFMSISWADVVIIKEGGGTQWQCSSSDSDDKHWVASSQFERTSMNKAYDTCKKESRVPETCKTAKANCEAIIHGNSTRPMWQCTALDQMAKHWTSDFYTQRDDAALGAKAFCQQRSGMPESCYINLMTCKNVNESPI